MRQHNLCNFSKVRAVEVKFFCNYFQTVDFTGLNRINEVKVVRTLKKKYPTGLFKYRKNKYIKVM